VNPPLIGEMKDLIKILNVTAPYSVNGEGTLVSEFMANVRAKVEPLGGNMLDETQQTQAYSQAYNIWIRYVSGVTPFQQIEWQSKRLVMTGPPEKISNWLLLHAEERTSREF